MPPSEPEDLKRLGERIDAAKGKNADPAPQSSLAVAVRFGAELVPAVLVGGATGWGIDWVFLHGAHLQTRPWGMVVMVILGAATGIRNVIRAAQEMYAQAASKEK